MLSATCNQTSYDWSKNRIIRKKKKISAVPERRESLAASQVRKGALWNSLILPSYSKKGEGMGKMVYTQRSSNCSQRGHKTKKKKLNARRALSTISLF